MTDLGYKALRLLLKVVIVIPGAVLENTAPFEGKNRRANAIEKVTIVTDHDHGAAESNECLFEQSQGAKIEIVSGLVQNENVATALENFREQDSTPLTSAELIDLRVDAFFCEQESP